MGKDTVNNFFTGYIDEIRVWRASLTGDVLKNNIYNELSADEKGLVAYYPFNRLVYGAQDIVQTDSTLDNFVPSDVLITHIVGEDTLIYLVDQFATLTGATLQKIEAPVLTPQPLLESVAHTFSANNEKIIFNITEMPSLIENTTLNISVQGVLDLSNNPSNVVNWTAFIHRNRLIWSENEMTISKKYLETKTFTVAITNQSGVTDNWLISNLPVWLSVSETQGTLQPLATKNLTFTISESMPAGAYEATAYLTGNQLINTPLNISLKVIYEAPDWHVNVEDFEESMSVIGQVYFDGKVSKDPDDIVAAFNGNVCVGLAKPTYYSNFDAYYVMMDI
jgi:hypothetical protein